MASIGTDEDVDREDLIEELNDLIQLDFDAVRAYDQAIEKVEDDDARDDLQQFKLDHERHIQDLGKIVRKLGGVPKDGPDLKGILLEGMTALRSATGTLGALKAMRMNEKITNKSYAKALELPLSQEFLDVVMRNREDERRHLIAIRAHIARLDEEFDQGEDLLDDIDSDVRTDDRPGAVF